MNEWKFIDKIQLLKRQMNNGIDYCRLELLKCHDKMTREREKEKKTKIHEHIEFLSKSISKIDFIRVNPFTCMIHTAVASGNDTDECAHCLSQLVILYLFYFVIVDVVVIVFLFV